MQISMLLSLFAACDTADLSADIPGDLQDRAYVVSKGSDELFVFDVATQQALGSVDTKVFAGLSNSNHMSLVSPDGAQVFVIASHANSVVVVDARTLAVTDSVVVGAHASHGAFTSDGAELWISIEDDNKVVVMDTESHQVLHEIADSSMVIPHNVRFSADGLRAFVPSIGGNQVTVIDTTTYSVIEVLVPQGMQAGACEGDPCGFADAQIDDEGRMYAAHIESGTLMVYDTVAMEPVEELRLGSRPWAAFVDVGDVSPAAWMVPNFGDATVSVVQRDGLKVETVPHGDEAAYGVNYSALTPGSAYVLNKFQEQIAILDAQTGALDAYVDVGGTTETATTTPDGQFILLPLSSTGELAIFDVETRAVVKRFPNVGTYPWSVSMAAGQNYCH